MNLSKIQTGAQIRGLLPGGAIATVGSVRMVGLEAAEVTFTDAQGQPYRQLVFAGQEEALKLVGEGRAFSFSADAAQFRLVSEAQRIRLAHLFDPLVAVNTSDVRPLPHQITAVYETMLNRQPLRFILADDPGAGKTIMAGLLIKELMIRGDVSRCLIVTPGSLVEQWQDELDQKFNLGFNILTDDAMEASRTGNWFLEHSCCLCRLDKLSRSDVLQEKLAQADWDLIIVDEAHKMSASYFGGEVKQTKRFKLGKFLSSATRQLLLLTATPHNGKEEDFQLFMSILDGDRFEGRPSHAPHSCDTADLMRRLVKEQLVTMDGKPLFPDRFAYTLEFQLSTQEAALYESVTTYVREQFNAAEKLDKNRRGTVGFALTILQRRLASSPAAIHQSLRRRRERLEKRLREEKLLKRGAEARMDISASGAAMDEEAINDLEEQTEAEWEAAEEQVADLSTAAATIFELEREIATLAELEKDALAVLNSGEDTKWVRLAEALQDNPLMFDASRQRRKLVIFTEHRDTLFYLQRRLASIVGAEAIVCVHGQTPRDHRRALQESFTSDPKVLIFLATDAAGEGINLQRGHLMVNYDLPWNPNRLEQRFGRIHRIGQREVCHLWNLVAIETREGDVYHRLLQKLEEERKALNGAVFDVLGQLFRDTTLKDILIDAIRKADTPEQRARFHRIIDTELDRTRIRQLLEERQLNGEGLPPSRVQEIRDMLERSQTQKLQPYHIGSFFEAAFAHIGGQMQRREPMRFEIRHVPSEVRQRDRTIGRSAPVLRAYERVTFHKEVIRPEGKIPAAFIAPGHPLLDAVIDLVLERNRDLLRQGTILVDPHNRTDRPRLLLYVQSDIFDARPSGISRSRRLISQRLQFLEMEPSGAVVHAGYAPYLDYLPPTEAQMARAAVLLEDPWLSLNPETAAMEFAVTQLVPGHIREVRTRREAHILKTLQQVHERLTREIAYWDNRATELARQEEAGRSPGKLNSTKAAAHRDRLTERLRSRTEELEQERHITASPPIVPGGALIILAVWFQQPEPEDPLSGRVREDHPDKEIPLEARRESERLSMLAVMDEERRLGHHPLDVSSENRGYDIESRDGSTGSLRFLEVKGRIPSAATVTLTRNELLCALNNPENWFLVIVPVDLGQAADPIYIREPFRENVEFYAARIDLKLNLLVPGKPSIQA